MIKLDTIDDNKYNNDFHLGKYFYQLIMIDNQNIFDNKGEIK